MAKKFYKVLQSIGTEEGNHPEGSIVELDSKIADAFGDEYLEAASASEAKEFEKSQSAASDRAAGVSDVLNRPYDGVPRTNQEAMLHPEDVGKVALGKTDGGKPAAERKAKTPAAKDADKAPSTSDAKAKADAEDKK